MVASCYLLSHSLKKFPLRRGSHIGLGLVPAADRKVSRIPSELLGLVGPPTDRNITVKPSTPDVERDTMPLIIEKAKRTAWQTKKLAARLKGATLAETLNNDSGFILKYIRYTKDSPDHEQIRSPRRLIYDAQGDCDCFAVTLATLLINQGINFRFRIAEYANSPGQWSHIYIVVPKDQKNSKSLTSRQDYTVLDPVTNLHDYEVDYARKRDYTMSLQYLDGFSRQGRLGECPPKNTATAADSATSAQPVAGDKPVAIDFTTKQSLDAVDMKSTVDVLQAAGIPFMHNIDENNNPTVIVATPQGSVQLPTLLDNNTASLLTSLTNTPQDSGTPIIESVQFVPSKLGYVLAGGAFLGLLAWAFSGSSKRGKLSGPQQTARKKVNVLHI